MTHKTRGSKVTVNCKCCGVEFEARLADRKRGWAKFCSKSCKALKQESRTGQMKGYLRRSRLSSEDKSKPINLSFGYDADCIQQANDHSLGENEMSWAEDYYEKS